MKRSDFSFPLSRRRHCLVLCSALRLDRRSGGQFIRTGNYVPRLHWAWARARVGGLARRQNAHSCCHRHNPFRLWGFGPVFGLGRQR